MHGFTELSEKKTIQLKKKIEFNLKDWKIYTDKNRLRVNSKYFDHNLQNNDPKILFIGDSVPFGFGVNYENSIPGNIDSINKKLISINGAIPSYSISQSVKKYQDEFINLKNVKYIYFQTFNPVNMYVLYGKKWDEKKNWYNHLNTFYKNIFFFKYDKIPIWGDVNFFKILRKIYILYFFEIPEIIDNQADEFSDLRFINHINKELNKLYNLLNKNTVLILAPVTTPLHLKKKNNILKSKIESDENVNRLRIINLINEQIKSFQKKNVIYFDTIKILKKYENEKIFIDDCCHLSKNGALKISEHLNEILNE